MTAPSHRYTVALQGFTPFERGALASFFRLAASRTPAYVQAERLDACDFVVADGDDARSVQAVRDAGRMADTVFHRRTDTRRHGVAGAPRRSDAARARA
jgi:hypothetical protein